MFASLQVPHKKPLNKALSMMDLEETVDESRDPGRAPPCKRPRRTDRVVADLGSPAVVGDQTVSCSSSRTYIHTCHLRCIQRFIDSPVCRKAGNIYLKKVYIYI